MSEDFVNIEINGAPFKARRGSMIIEIADQAGILVPRFCYHEKLSIAANCRMCLVEVEKAPKPLPACATPVMDGMKVHTRSPLAVRAQKSVMEFLLINHPLDCPICDQGGECELQDLAMGYGRDVSRFNERKRVVEDKDLGPLIATDMTRCIHCTRCVRFGDEIAGLPELGVTGRGESMQIGTFIEQNIASELSGNVIDVCPVGALTSKPFRYRARAWEIQQRNTVSPHDAVGSNLHVHLKGNRVVRVVPRENEAVNEVWISDRDRFSYDGLYSEDRLSTPMIKRDGEWQAVDWESALSFAVEGLTKVREAHGAEQLGALASPSATLEELLLVQKLMRGIGSNNVDHRLRQTDFSDQDAAPLMPTVGDTLAGLGKSNAVLLVGSNCRHEQPLINHRLRRAVLDGGRVSLINPIDYPFNYEVAHKIIANPVGMVHALAGVAKALRAKPEGEAGTQLGKILTRVKVDEVHRDIAASLKDGERATVLLGASALAHPHAAALRGLGAFIAEHTGASLGQLSEGANSAGAWLAGALPHREAGGRAVSKPGLDAGAMIEKGLKGWLLLGLEPELDCHDGAAALAAVEGPEFVLALSAYNSPAMAAYADVLLPIAPFAETSGTFINGEGLWQSFAAAVAPLNESRPAWKVLRVLGNLWELEGFDYVASSAIRDELREIANAVASDATVTWTLPDKLPSTRKKGLHRIGDVPMYAVDPLVRRAPSLQDTAHAADAQIRLHPLQAERLGLEPGDLARAQQDGAGVVLTVAVDAQVPEDCVHLWAGVPGSSGLGPSFGPIKIKKA